MGRIVCTDRAILHCLTLGVLPKGCASICASKCVPFMEITTAHSIRRIVAEEKEINIKYTENSMQLPPISKKLPTISIL